MVKRIVLTIAIAIAASGCWDWSRFEGDAGPDLDAGPRDAGPRDAGDTGDAGDAGSVDAGCTGCMQAGECLPGDIPTACGSGGDTCVACACDDTCTAGACTPRLPVVAMGTGHHFACFVVDDGSVYCMGDNESGQLGIGSTSPGSAVPVPATSSGFDLASGGDVFLALLAPGGAASYWGIRPGDSLAGTPATSAASLSGTFDRIAAGGEFACGIRGTALSCTGDNSSGQLGQGDYTTRSSFVSITGSWLDVSVGLAHACGIQDVGGERQMFCWGANESGQLGIGNTTEQATPQRVGTDTDWQQVSAGKDFTCAIATRGLYCWGNNDSQQLGGSPRGQESSPFGPLGVGGAMIANAVAVDAGRFNACVRRADGSLWCWGSNDCGALGDGSMSTTRTEPVLVVTTDVEGMGWDNVEVGHHIACATRENGSLYCWGRSGGLMAEQNTVCGAAAPGPPSPRPLRICL